MVSVTTKGPRRRLHDKLDKLEKQLDATNPPTRKPSSACCWITTGDLNGGVYCLSKWCPGGQSPPLGAIVTFELTGLRQHVDAVGLRVGVAAGRAAAPCFVTSHYHPPLFHPVDAGSQFVLA